MSVLSKKFENNYDRLSRDPVIGRPELGVLFFGALYFLYRGLYGKFFLFLLLLIPTLGIVWFYYIFKARRIITEHYWKAGYWDGEL